MARLCANQRQARAHRAPTVWCGCCRGIRTLLIYIEIQATHTKLYANIYGIPRHAFQRTTHRCCIHAPPSCIHAPILRIYIRTAQLSRTCAARLNAILRSLLIGAHEFPFSVEKVSFVASVLWCLVRTFLRFGVEWCARLEAWARDFMGWWMWKCVCVVGEGVGVYGYRGIVLGWRFSTGAGEAASFGHR